MIAQMPIDDEALIPADPSPPIMWMKICDPDTALPPAPAGTDVRVLVPTGAQFESLRTTLAAQRIPYREVRYLREQELIANIDPHAGLSSTVSIHGRSTHSPRPLTGAAAQAARDGFDLMWHEHSSTETASVPPVPAETILPAQWVRFLPYPVLNPAQAEAIPQIVGSDDHLLVVAPTGAGKTVIGMVGVLRTVLEQGKKAAWLVPQRSLTEELNRELDSWRSRGLRVERLSGEHRVDAERIRSADLWVTTTEKFEALSRTSSMREALAEVGCLVVDEIHLVGDTSRGSFLEAILARVRDDGSRIRIVGLSATVANADQLASWLHARTVRVHWRPTQLTWQLPTVVDHADWSLTEAAKIRVTASIVTAVSESDGSVLVFCGSKRSVRRTALIIAASRGADVFHIDPDDTDAVYSLCQTARIGLHYKGWEHKKEAEKGFRERELNVLVATSTVAAGVNLPARAVVVQDTEVAMKPIDVATVQQMFGRAGRLGAGERQGWAFLLVNETERAIWQRKLLSGFRVNSQIHSSLADHVLAEAIQGRIQSTRDAERWWKHTLAHHQGSHDMTPVRHAVGFLLEGEFLQHVQASDDSGGLAPTELGMVTGRLMVSPTVCFELRRALSSIRFPGSADDAENELIEIMATHVPKLAHAAVSEALKSRVLQVKWAHGSVDHRPGYDHPVHDDATASYAPGDLARAAMLAIANSPNAFHRNARTIGGIPYSTLSPVLEEAPRYLHWLGCQGFLSTVHPWVAIVAADLSRRIRWRRCQPPRGSGRLLWMCEQMATAAHAEDIVPELWTAATDHGRTNPDWSETGRPRRCRLDQSDYALLLKERTTNFTLTEVDGQISVSRPSTGTLVTWSGTDFDTVPSAKGQAEISAGTTTQLHGATGAALFTRRGDYRATGWLNDYQQILKDQAQISEQPARAR
ncbi:DEAD/DEAH box helicase [Nocardia salmonicida]|uniref:DEAD/DEAH box helicase n=1 Tax=Nocardia salmonicida TaxID=53431 RepID=UPI001BDE8324|nr:DEAD/DEAH box helicase [Nocardia salmonicida]